MAIIKTKKIARELRQPNLGTILMVEDFLQNQKNKPLKLSEIKEKLPKQVMHQTLKVILEYLWKSGKISYGPNGIEWIFNLKSNFKNGGISKK